MKPSIGQLYLNSTSEEDGATISSEEELNESTLLVFLPATNRQLIFWGNSNNEIVLRKYLPNK